MRCPDCNKFVSYEIEVEDTNPEPDQTRWDVTITSNPPTCQVEGSVNVLLNCAECGNALASYLAEFDETVELSTTAKPLAGLLGTPHTNLPHLADLHTATVEEDDRLVVEIEADVYDDGKRKRHVGATGSIYVKWDGNVIGRAEFVDSVTTSEFESLV